MQNKKWKYLFIVSIWVSVTLVGFLNFINPSSTNALCSFHRYEPGMMSVVILILFNIMIPVVVHILVAGLIFRAVSHVRSSRKVARGSDVSMPPMMRIVLYFF